MWKFSGIVEYKCDACGDSGEIPIEDFSVDCTGGGGRGMGPESLYDVIYEFECPECDADISLNFQVSEYPVEVLNFTLNNSTGAQTQGEPEFEYLEDIYSAPDLLSLYNSIPELIQILKDTPELVRDIEPREFEEVVAEIFRNKGFEVELTKRTRDGGKDIIAISTDRLGIKNKYFIECKRHAKENKVSVDIVRGLQGVKHTKEGPNKTIVATTSYFTEDAKKFVDNEITSSWDMTLADFNDITKWLQEY
jgi:restriction system protein